MQHHRQRHRFFAIALLGLVTLLPACAHAMPANATLDVRIKAQLDVLREVVEPVVQLADTACAREQRLYLAAAKAGPKDQVVVQEGKATEAARRCAHLQAAFDTIRELHDQAATLLESGKLQEAQDRVQRARDRWRALSAPEEGAAWQRPSGSRSGGRLDPRSWNSDRLFTASSMAIRRPRSRTSNASARICRSSRPRVMRQSRALPS